MVTVDTPVETVLKEDIMKDVYLEAYGDAKVKVYEKIGGLVNLGKTYFWNEKELDDVRLWVNAQMVQKYGAEIYGSSAQLKSQNKDGTSDAIKRSGELISCSVVPLVDLSKLTNESSDINWKRFNDNRKDFLKMLDELEKDTDLQNKCGFTGTQFDDDNQILHDNLTFID